MTAGVGEALTTIRFVLHDRTVSTVRWPAVPGLGEIVTFDLEDRPDLTGDYKVDRVRWLVGEAGELREVEVVLVPGW